MIVDENEPIKLIRFVPASEESCYAQGKSYIFKCRARLNYETQTIDVDMIFENDHEKREYEEFEKSRKSGVQYYSEIPDL